MKKIICLILMSFLILVCYLEHGYSINNKLKLLNLIVSNLGLTKKNPLKQIESLHYDAHLVVPMLLKELHIINPYALTSKELIKKDRKAMHVIWCIRALRSITGKKFTSNTKTTNRNPLQEFLNQNNPLPFFAEWMSRAIIYVAPQDVQEIIINEWKTFIKRNPKFKVRKYQFFNDDSWYF